jgi:RsiW-degrading membrane proteinase PrsW (M82 family)
VRLLFANQANGKHMLVLRRYSTVGNSPWPGSIKWPMFAFLLHGRWDTILAAILFWLSPFIALFLVVNWVLRRRRKRRHSGS